MTTTQQQHKISWRTSKELSGHAWRFFLSPEEHDAANMSAPAHDAWLACNKVWSALNPSEQNIVRDFHTGMLQGFTASYIVTRIAKDNHTTSEHVWKVVNNASRLWAIERGVADE